MKKVFIVSMALLLTACNNHPKPIVKVDTNASDIQKMSYILGVNSAKDLQDNKLSIDYFLQGISDAKAGKIVFSGDEVTSIIDKFKSTEYKLKDLEERVYADVNDQFFDENSRQFGVEQTPSGLQYIVQDLGTGKTPTLDDTVTISYDSELLTGQVLEQRPNEQTVAMRDLIKGLAEGLTLIAEGGTVTLWLPPNLAFGDTGTATIPPNSIVQINVTLQKVH